MTFPALGFGLGLRVPHYEAILATRPPIDWFEVLTENYLVAGGKPLHYLMRIRERYPLVMHGVSMSIGSALPMNSRMASADFRAMCTTQRLCSMKVIGQFGTRSVKGIRFRSLGCSGLRSRALIQVCVTCSRNWGS